MEKSPTISKEKPTFRREARKKRDGSKVMVYICSICRSENSARRCWNSFAHEDILKKGE